MNATERNLVLRAAKAAGYELTFGGACYGELYLLKGKLWDPLNDDGDAFRLMTDLKINLKFVEDADGEISVAECKSGSSCKPGDAKGARKAIVTVAALGFHKV